MLNSLRTGRFGKLPLLWKLLIPFVSLIVVLGVFGALLIVRDLSSRAEAALHEDLIRRSLEGRSLLHDRELYLLESVNFASNLEGIAEAVRDRNEQETSRLLQSVVALKSDLALVAITDAVGKGLAGYLVDEPGAAPSPIGSEDWTRHDPVARAIGGEKAAAFMETSGRWLFTIATPICSAAAGCDSVGVAIGALDLQQIVAEVATSDDRATSSPTTAGIYGLDGHLLAASGPLSIARRIRTEEGLVRRIHGDNQSEVATLFAPLDIQGKRVGTLSVGIPTKPAFASVRGAGFRLAMIFLAAISGVLVIGAVLGNTILRKVQRLLDTNRALGEGDLSARVPVTTGDELGELAQGVNQMAEQLQASYQSLELRVAQRTEEIKRLLNQRSELFASLSHEFRTPLAVVLKRAEILRELLGLKTGSSTEAAKEIAAVEQSAQQLLSLVNDILELAEGEAGEIEVELSEVDVARVSRELRGTIESLANGGKLKASFNIPRNLPSVRADERRLREVLLNLIDNAVKYTPEGGKVELSASALNGRVEVSVSDTGIGIPPDAADQIFEPFYRVEGAKPQRGEKSTGLGLTIAKLFVEAQGGKIRLEPKPGDGSTFIVSLPATGSKHA